MLDQLTVRELKGAPLSILLVLQFCKRNVTARWLCQQTGYSDKPVADGLRFLMERGMVTRIGHSGFMLAGEEYQLPLSWDVKLEPYVGETPISDGDFPMLLERMDRMERRLEALENRKNSGEAGEIPMLSGETPFCDDVVDVEEVGETPIKAGEIPTEVGDSPISDIDVNNIYPDKDLVGWLDIDTNQPIKKSIVVNSDREVGEIPTAARTAWKCAAGQVSESELIRGAVLLSYEDGRFTVALDNKYKIPTANNYLRGLLEEILSTIMHGSVSVVFTAPDPEAAAIPLHAAARVVLLQVPQRESYPGEIRNTEICNEYLQDPIGIEYTVEHLRELVALRPDPDVLRFVLPAVSSFDSARTWCGWDLTTAKFKLLKMNGVMGAARSELSHNADLTLQMIQDVFDDLKAEEPNRAGKGIYRLKEMLK